MKQESCDILKAEIIKTYKKNGDKEVLTVFGENSRTYTGNELAIEIEMETKFGVGLINNIIQLAIDLLSRNKVKYEPKYENILNDWCGLIEKQKNNEDVWTEIPELPQYKFKNLKLISSPFEMKEESVELTISFKYDEFKEIN